MNQFLGDYVSFPRGKQIQLIFKIMIYSMKYQLFNGEIGIERLEAIELNKLSNKINIFIFGKYGILIYSLNRS